MCENLIARKNSYGNIQSLWKHSKNVAEISASISHYPNTSMLLAYLHDIGKASTDFQNYIKNGGERGSVIHAWQGAFLANEIFSSNSDTEKLLKEIIDFCVTSHHNHLNDGVAPDGETKYFDRFLSVCESKYSFDDIIKVITPDVKVELKMLFDNATDEINCLLNRIKEVYRSLNSAEFAIGLLVKYFYSCLIDADRLDAFLFDINEPYKCQKTDWNSLIDIFEGNISKFPISSEIDCIRKSVSDKCKAAADKETGIYQLSVPTGGGKTLSSLRFALHHCKKHNKNRIIYIVPYLSIIEQTAKNLNDILDLCQDNEVIFEHHSNIMEPEDEKFSEQRKLTAARWDSPIIITTVVQFLESVMSAKSGKLRKFASMADSVIIFDEIQAMPIKSIHCFNEVATFLSKILNSTIILCSATQPALESTQRANLLLQDNHQLIDCEDDFKDIKRVTVLVESKMDSNSAADFILEKAIHNGNCLAIVNTKKSALEIYDQLKTKTKDFIVLHLSTSMCPVHRMQIIDRMKDCLKHNKNVICVSTQLIEAGVDISFSCVVRAMSGLDSIAQAAGRCNRNGESSKPKKVYTFVLKDENLDFLSDIKSGKEITEQMIWSKTDNSDLLDRKCIRDYYKRYFSVKEGQMEYPTKYNTTVYAMLSENSSGKDNYTNRTGKQFQHLIHHAFDTADKSFSVIDANTQSVVVMYGDAENLIEEYRNQPCDIYTKEKVRILKKLQRHSVSLYEWQLKKLLAQNALYPLDKDTGILILGANYYSQQTGVAIDAIQDNLII